MSPNRVYVRFFDYSTITLSYVIKRFRHTLRTPLRDTLSIRPREHSTSRDGLRDRQLHSISAKRTLRAGFMSLPRLEINFKLLVPDASDDPGEAPIVSLSEKDASDR